MKIKWTRNMTLYELTGQFLSLMEMAEEGDVTPEALADTMECVGMEIEDKADEYVKIIKKLEMEVAGYKTEEDRLAKRRMTVENNIKRLNQTLKDAMIATGKTKFKTNLFSFGIRKNAPSLDCIDEEHVPEKFWKKQPDTLDKRAILSYIKENGPVDWATTKQTESLRID